LRPLESLKALPDFTLGFGAGGRWLGICLLVRLQSPRREETGEFLEVETPAMQDLSASTSVQPMPIAVVEPETDHPAVLAVGGSAGSVKPLVEIVRGLPRDLAAAVLITIHVGEQTRLPQILSRSGLLQATHVRDGEVLEHGRIYIAPPGQHLIVRSGHALLTPGPRVNRHRPAVDVMFASAAEWVAMRAVAVVLSGALDDGAVGAALVAQAGGQVLVQDPAEAEFASMPRSALAAAPGARVVSVRELAQAVRDSLDVAQSLRSDPAPDEARMRADRDMVESDDPGYLREDESRLTRLSCPDCGRSMAQVDLPQISYFRCQVGHQFAPQALAAAQAEVSEKKLGRAVTALEEQAAVLRHMQRRASRQRQVALPDQDQTSSAQERYAEEIASRAVALRTQVREWSSRPARLDTRPE
jgi:two-component system, chemotaxis family, protein-glutamate methylesterase/glutaminase